MLEWTDIEARLWRKAVRSILSRVAQQAKPSAVA